jgi:hypothetical protein
MCVSLANNLLDFLQVHKMDTDSALIGLSPSNFTFDACIEQERHLPHQLMGWKTLEGSGLKQEVRKTVEKVIEWTSVTKGTIMHDSYSTHLYHTSFSTCISFTFILSTSLTLILFIILSNPNHSIY